MTTPVHAVLSAPLKAGEGLPADIQYMPPGRHRINASRGGKPVTLELEVDATTATTLNKFLRSQLSGVEAGKEDRPYFDFNHEDREASAWPIEFYWAGDDPTSGGVRAKVEWSGAGKAAVEQKTFRRFSPTFIPDGKGRVVGSTTNMGGLVNRAAFKSIQPLFAKRELASDTIHEAQQREDGQRGCVGPEGVTEAGARRALKEQPLFAKGELGSEIIHRPHQREDLFMNTLIETLKSVGLVKATQAAGEDEAALSVISTDVKSSIGSLRAKLEDAESRATSAEAKLNEAEDRRLKELIEDAVKAGRIAPSDEASKSFWLDALKRGEVQAVKALSSLPVNPVLERVTDGGGEVKAGALDKMAQQQRKLAEVQAANPNAPFETIFAKAQAESPQLFS